MTDHKLAHFGKFMRRTRSWKRGSERIELARRRVSSLSSKPVSELLAKWEAGDQEALRALVPLVYNELRRLAHYHLQRERPGHTLQSAALVHEAYLRLTKQRATHFENRAHFLAVSAQLMRQILVKYARTRRAAKRYGGQRVTWTMRSTWVVKRGPDLLALDDALTELTRLDSQQGRIVELRFFGDLSIEEIAYVLTISPSTVKREWRAARAWLHREMKRVAYPFLKNNKLLDRLAGIARPAVFGACKTPGWGDFRKKFCPDEPICVDLGLIEIAEMRLPVPGQHRYEKEGS